MLKPLLSDLKTFILDILFPITCFGCEKEGKYICTECRAKLTPTHQVCIGCKKPSLAGLTHPKCQSPQTPDQLLSFFDYKDNVVSNLLIKGKYYFIQDIFSEFGEIIAEKITKDFPQLLTPPAPSLNKEGEPASSPPLFQRGGREGLMENSENKKDVIPASELESIPGSRIESGMTKINSSQLETSIYKLLAIPLHKSRLRWRGFNQSETFAKTLANKLNLPIANFLIRSKPTKTQKDLKREQRIKNIESAFAISPPSIEEDTIKSPLFSKEGVRGSSFILLDDVTTTGSTLLEATKVLKRNGAKKVICLTIARD